MSCRIINSRVACLAQPIAQLLSPLFRSDFLREVMRFVFGHASVVLLATPPRTLTFLFQVDSKLLAEQVSGRWACRSVTLRPCYAECLAAGRQLSKWGWKCRVDHIYRNFNSTADSFANLALDEVPQRSAVFSERW